MEQIAQCFLKRKFAFVTFKLAVERGLDERSILLVKGKIF